MSKYCTLYINLVQESEKRKTRVASRRFIGEVYVSSPKEEGTGKYLKKEGQYNLRRTEQKGSCLCQRMSSFFNTTKPLSLVLLMNARKPAVLKNTFVFFLFNFELDRIDCRLHFLIPVP